MVSESDIRQKLNQLDKGQLPLDDFEQWFISDSRNMFKNSSSEAIELSKSIHLLLSERNAQLLSDTELLQDLLALVAYPVRLVSSSADESENHFVAVVSAPRRFNRSAFRLHGSPVFRSSAVF